MARCAYGSVVFLILKSKKKYMKQALIDPTTQVSALTSWTENPDPAGSPKYFPVWTVIDNSARVAQVASEGGTFPVAPPLFWTGCGDDVVADQWYYNTQTNQVSIVPPPVPQPDAQGN